jgi:hypothetical protein
MGKMSRTCTVSPFNCRWIAQASIAQLGDYKYAVCSRNRHCDRIVNEAECARCPRWEDAGTAADEPKAWDLQPRGFLC